jgi:hypothetical protein
VSRLAAYVRAAADRLAEQNGEALGRAELSFPEPAGIVTAETQLEGANR